MILSIEVKQKGFYPHDIWLFFKILKNNYQQKKSFRNYGLCPSCYLSAPGFSWEAVLSLTKVKLELILDPDMYLFFEKGMRGGVPYISKRYSKTNNKYLKSYDPKQESKYIIYLDRNNLYCLLCSSFFKQAVSNE